MVHRAGRLGLTIVMLAAAWGAPAHADRGALPSDAPGSTPTLQVPPALRDSALAHIDPQTLRDPDVQRHLRMILPEEQGGLGFTYIAANETEAYAFPLAREDVDGDGLPDVVLVEYEVTYDQGFNRLSLALRYAAIRGVDGTVLWRTTVETTTASVYVKTADVDGDGSLDVLELSIDRIRTLGSSRELSTWELDQRISVVDGASGVKRAIYSLEGTTTVSDVPTFPKVSVAENAISQVDVMRGDANGGPRVIASVQHWRKVFSHSYSAGTPPEGLLIDTGTCDTAIEAFDGETGAHVATVEQGTRDVCPLMVAGADTDGDGSAEITLGTRTELERFDLTGESIWRAPAPIEDHFLLLREQPVKDGTSHDITALGVNLYIFFGDGILFLIKSDHFVTVDGSNGRVMLDLHTDGYGGFFASSARPGATDVFDLQETETEPLIVTATTGIGEGTIWRRVGGNASRWASLTSVADVDGVPGDDLIVLIDSGTRWIYDVELWSGADASTYWALDDVGGEAVPFAVFGDLPNGRADVDGDGAEDLETRWRQPTQSVNTYVRGSDLTVLGAITTPTDVGWRYALGMHDVDGDGIAEAFVEHESDDENTIELYDFAGRVWTTPVGLRA